MTIRWSLITVSYNSAETLRSHWASPRSSHVEWIVVDNASKDESADVAEALGATVIRLDTNRGFGGANNVGFRAAQGDYIAFVNPDIIVDFDSLTDLERSLQLQGDTLLGPQLVYPDGTLQPSGRGVPSMTDKVLSRLGNKRVRDRYYMTANPGQIREVAWLVGAAVVSKKSTFERLGQQGPWDERFFVYYEDADIALRAWRDGIPVRVIGDAQWVHSWARETSGKFSFTPWKLELGGMWAFYTRYPAMFLGIGGSKWWRQLRLSRWGEIL